MSAEDLAALRLVLANIGRTVSILCGVYAIVARATDRIIKEIHDATRRAKEQDKS